MFIDEGSEQAREHVLSDRCRRSQRQLSGDLPARSSKFSFCFGDDSRYILCVVEQEGSLRSEGDAIGGAVEKANTEVVLERSLENSRK